VETFINKTDRTLALQFRGDTDRALGIIRENFPGLSSEFINKGYTISAASFKRIDEPFTILDTIDPKGADNKDIRRFSFDMRV
jgi:hypothetical protein